MYAILDIETTGGAFDEEGITEIAIYKFDGHQVVDQFISLVNPEKPIQPFVVNLTGINNKMLRNAPKFYEVAKRIVEITEGCILVAHNSSFDYRILRTEFRRLGFDYERKSLCTVELSQKLMPEQESYKLGKLVRALGIPMSDRHRANGDALATVQLFKMLMAKDTKKEIIQNTIKSDIPTKLSTRLLNILDGLPSETGVYYIHREDGEIIYIGKSKNIRKTINQHFTGNSQKAKKIQLEVHAVSFEKTGNELIALLKEQEEIRQNQPRYNHTRKSNIFNYGLRAFMNGTGYTQLQVERARKEIQYLTTFKHYNEAKKTLFKITEEHGLCQKLTGLHRSEAQCLLYDMDECYGACINEEPVEKYNVRVERVLQQYSFQSKDIVILDKGRDIDERSAILIQNGEYKGYGFVSLNHQVNNLSVLRSIITPMANNADVRHLIQAYLRKRKVLKIIELNA
ncbi:exonuclease domain-containing protein [Sungkyunkwania multivorans]|uniref:Exonuclease domain-containing protein n=1 Tax=Sungkyunkwania multivorans TaxID=1173618 RepID=A0ABW3CYA3_9FLAO